MVNEIVHDTRHVESFCETLIQRFLRRKGRVLCLPLSQQVVVVVEDLDTVGDILLLGI